jgi:integrase/recombinase XerD
VTHLRQMMLDELQRRNDSQSTARTYIHAVEDFAKYFHRSPERLGPEHIRRYQAYLFRERKLSPGTIEGRTAALRFLFIKTLRRPYLPDYIPFPKRQRRLPTILDQQEVARLIDSAGNLMHRTMMMMLYATGLRRAEMWHLKVSDIDSKRMAGSLGMELGGAYLMCSCGVCKIQVRLRKNFASSAGDFATRKTSNPSSIHVELDIVNLHSSELNFLP